MDALCTLHCVDLMWVVPTSSLGVLDSTYNSIECRTPDFVTKETQVDARAFIDYLIQLQEELHRRLYGLGILSLSEDRAHVLIFHL